MPEHRSIGELAYRLWQSRGCPEGTAEQDWLDAERQLLATQSTVRPAKSEAVDDSPPANAAAKWKAAAAPKKSPRRSNSSRGNPNNDATR
jgi:Protein of unknown function (DUF2934)